MRAALQSGAGATRPCAPDRILLAGGDAPIARQVAAALRADGLTLDHAATMRDALMQLTDGAHGLVIVVHEASRVPAPREPDGAAGMDGAALAAAMRAMGASLPVLALDAGGDTGRCIRLLQAGADDYLAGPFDGGVVGARVRALLRRHERGSFGAEASGVQARIQAGGLVLDRIRRVVLVDAERVTLRPTEFRLLEYLMMNPDRVATRRMILEAVWQHHFDPGTNLIEVHVKQLRAKLGDRRGTRFIRTVRSAGYVFCGEAAPAAKGEAEVESSSASDRYAAMLPVGLTSPPATRGGASPA